MHTDERHLWKYVDGELSPAEAAAVEAAAADDADLRRTIEELRIIKEEILAGAPRPADGFAARVAARARWQGHVPAVDLDEARAFLRRALVAAALLAALGLAYLTVEVVPQFFEPIQAQPLLPR